MLSLARLRRAMELNAAPSYGFMDLLHDVGQMSGQPKDIVRRNISALALKDVLGPRPDAIQLPAKARLMRRRERARSRTYSLGLAA
ncbi:MAG: hypothetical protein ACOY99_08035 [Pseudomonadota bacterium]